MHVLLKPMTYLWLMAFVNLPHNLHLELLHGDKAETWNDVITHND